MRLGAGMQKIYGAEKEPTAEELCQPGARVEVQAPSKRWRSAVILKRSEGKVKVHYEGFDSQFDEEVNLDSGRFRAHGTLYQEGVAAKKSAFMREDGFIGMACTACGIPMQTSNPRKPGYIMPEHVPSGQVNNEAMTVDDEISLLLDSDGDSEQVGMQGTRKLKHNRFKVIENVFLDVRKEPSIDSERTDKTLTIGEEFMVSDFIQSPPEDGRIYFRLADGSGWVFDWANINGYDRQLIEPVQTKPRAPGIRDKVCLRCWALWNYNDVDDEKVDRPAFGTPPDELTAEHFQKMLEDTLKPVKKACILVVVDLYDFGPSSQVLRFLAETIRGKPGFQLKIIGNKLDLFPSEVNENRLKAWITREAAEAGLVGVRLNHVFCVSAATGINIKTLGKLIDKADAPNQFFLVGAANTGKSSIMNRMAMVKRKAPGSIPSEAQTGVCVSALPGTTLRPMSVTYKHKRGFQGKVRITDTPGLFMPGSFQQRLPFEDVKALLPDKKKGRRVTLDVMEGNTVMLGGLARMDLIEGRRPRFTMFTAQPVKIHRTRTDKVDATLEEWAGGALTPPKSRQVCLGMLPWVKHRFEFEGAGWIEACLDIVFDGLGWISVTGSGPVVVEAWAPEGVRVSRRQPLMPFEAKWTGVKYTGRPGWFTVKGVKTKGEKLAPNRKKILKLRGNW